MDNDGNAAALDEWSFGAGKDYENMLYIQVSTGVGSGMILGKQVYRGSGLAGEFGHMTVMADGPMCVCGKSGCVESLASGWALAREGRLAYETSIAGSPLHLLAEGDPQSIDADLVIEAARRGDPLATALIDRSFSYLGIGISGAIVLLDPQMVVLGGGITQSWDMLHPRLQASLVKHLPAMFHDRVKVTASKLSGTETLLGAAMLALGY